MDSAIKFEAARLHFLSDVFVARRRRCSLSFLRTHYVVLKKPRPRTLTRLNRPRVI